MRITADFHMVTFEEAQSKSSRLETGWRCTDAAVASPSHLQDRDIFRSPCKVRHALQPNTHTHTHNTSMRDARRAAYIMRRPTETKSLKVVLRCGWSVSVYLENVKFLAVTLAFTHAKYAKTVTAVTVAANGPRGCGSRFFCGALTKVGGFDAVEKRRSLPNKVAENTEVRRLK